MPASWPLTWFGAGTATAKVPQKSFRVTQTRADRTGERKAQVFRVLPVALRTTSGAGRGSLHAQPASRGDRTAGCSARISATGSSRWEIPAEPGVLGRRWPGGREGGSPPGPDPRAGAGGAAVCAQPLGVVGSRLEKSSPQYRRVKPKTCWVPSHRSGKAK